MGKGRSFFLTKTVEFDRVREKGSVIRNPFFTLVVARHIPTESTRIGIIAGRRAGNAVKRNRLKRVCRELVRGSSSKLIPGHECILYPKTRILKASFGEIHQVWIDMLAEMSLMQT